MLAYASQSIASIELHEKTPSEMAGAFLFINNDSKEFIAET